MTPGPFFITGLPRSRTAWLSVVADSQRHVTCVHEPTKTLVRWEDIGDIWNGTGPHIGVSDSCLGLHVAPILERWQPRTLIVERPMMDVATSLVNAKLPVSLKALGILQSRLDACHENPLVRVVPFESLNDLSVVLAVLEHLLPGALVDKAKVARMMDMNVQASTERSRHATQRIVREGGAAALLGQDFIDELAA